MCVNKLRVRIKCFGESSSAHVCVDELLISLLSIKIQSSTLIGLINLWVKSSGCVSAAAICVVLLLRMLRGCLGAYKYVHVVVVNVSTAV